MRFIAAIMVVFYHYSPTIVRSDLFFFVANGGEAVNFFFFLSGFVMIIANARYFSDKNDYFSRSDFYIKRIARIYPLYLFAILALAAFHYGIKPIDTPSVKYRLFFEVLGLQRWLYAGSFNYPGWTISCEFFFYLLFPFAIVYLHRNPRKFKIFVIGYWVFSCIMTTVLFYLKNASLSHIEKVLIDSAYLNPVLLISVFLLGMLCGKMFIENKSAFFKNQWNNRVCVLLGATLIFSVKFFIPGDYGLLKAGVLAPVYFVFITAVSSFKKSETRVFNSSLFLFLGEISYGIYILQYPVYTYFIHYIMPVSNGVSLLCFTGTLILVASITFYTIEGPFKRLILNYYNKNKDFVKVYPKQFSQKVN